MTNWDKLSHEEKLTEAKRLVEKEGWERKTITQILFTDIIVKDGEIKVIETVEK